MAQLTMSARPENESTLWAWLLAPGSAFLCLCGIGGAAGDCMSLPHFETLLIRYFAISGIQAIKLKALK